MEANKDPRQRLISGSLGVDKSPLPYSPAWQLQLHFGDKKTPTSEVLKDILKIDNTPRMEEVINSPPSEHSSTSEAGPDSLEESKDQDAESLSLKEIPQIYEDRLGSIYRRHAGVIEMPFDDIGENEADFN